MDLTLSNGNSFSDGQSMSASEGTEREAPFWRWLMRAAEDRRLVDGPQWRKSSHSGYNGSCVEAASWRTSTHSSRNGKCAEAGHGPGAVGVRDTKLGGASPVLEFPAAAWTAFTAGLRSA